MRSNLALACMLLALILSTDAQPQEPPADWIDPATGHRIIRLSKEPGTLSLYFHQNPYTATGDKFVVTTPTGVSTISFETREIRQIVEGRVSQIVVAPRSRQVFYRRGTAIYMTHIDSAAARKVADLPEGLNSGSGLAVNANETLLAGSAVVGDHSEAEQRAAATPPGKEGRLGARLALRLPMVLYTVNIATGVVNTFHQSTDWLNHVQMSPTDPDLIMFCHEGPWHRVERIWTIRTDGSDLKKIHTRTMDMEIWGHEFFRADGTIWYDLQTPRGKEFWFAGYDPESGQRWKYRVERSHWSVHYNSPPNGKDMFAGDGGGPNSVAAPGNGQWIHLFRAREDRLEAERLVNLEKHEYSLEPNLTFTPDGKWIVFRSNMHGPVHVYAVEVKRAKS